MKKNGFGKRIVVFSLCAMMIASSTNLTAYADDVEETHVDATMATGYVDFYDRPAQSIHQENEPELLMGTDNLESCYRTPKLPEVREQYLYRTCWAFASVACMETYLLNHPEEVGEISTIDLSELHLAYFANFSVVDPLGGTAGDFYQHSDPDVSWLDVGGTYEKGINALQDWVGPVAETEVPYTSAPNVLENGLDDSLAYGNDLYHLQGYRRICMEDTTDIKQAVIQYGSVGISFMVNDSFVSLDDNAAYYSNNENFVHAHAGVIVGWDDEYAKENFPKQPKNDGAWIVRNSWGSDWGDEGYFYMSYEEPSINDTGIVFIVESADNYQHNYQYDGAGVYNGTLGDGKGTLGFYTRKAANVFCVSTSDVEILEAVSFETSSINKNYTIQIYKNPTDSVNPETGDLLATLNGTIDYEGMYTVKLNKPVYLKRGDRFAVVVELKDKDGTPGGFIVADTSSHNSRYENVSSANAGQSLNYLTLRGWYDYGLDANANYHIKAYTDDGNPNDIVDATNVSISESQTTMVKGNSKMLTATVSPANATNQTVTWRSSDASVATVDYTGKVTAVGVGEAVITAKVGSCTVSCSVDVIIPLQGIELNQTTLNIRKGESSQLEVSYNPTDTTESKTITWNSSDTSVAIVDGEGKVKAVGAGEAVITAKVGSYVVSCTVTVYAPLQSIALNHTTLSLEKGESSQLQVTYNPTDTTSDKTVKWRSSSDRVIKVDGEGNIEAVGPGQAVVSAYIGSDYFRSDYKADCIVTVYAPLQGIGLSYFGTITQDGAAIIDKESSYPMYVVYNPTDTTDDRSVIWSSSDPSVATVDNNGIVTAVKAGEAVITAQVGSFTASRKVKVSVPLKGINVKSSTSDSEIYQLYLEHDDTCQLQVMYVPEDTTDNKRVDWSSSNPSVATVDNSGLVTAKRAGEAVITASVAFKTYKVDVCVTWTPPQDTTPNNANKPEQGESMQPQTGWISNGETWYYMNPSGAIATGWVNDGGTWYYMNSDGAMATGWVNDGEVWYYMNPSGAMATGWVNDGEAWYYMNSDGAMATGWVNDGETWYYMNSDGAMVTGWVNDGGTWYYMNSSGAMATGWVNDGGTWYYMKSSGAMAKGWVYTGGHWYYLYDSGAMAVNTRIGRYRIGADGVCK